MTVVDQFIKNHDYLYMTEKENIRWQIASSALQGVLESGKLGEVVEFDPDLAATLAIRMTDALMNKLGLND